MAVAVKDSATDTTYTAWANPTTNMAGDGDWLAFAGDAQSPEFDPINRGRPYTALMIDPNGDYSVFTSGKFSSRPGFKPALSAGRGLPTVKATAKWGYATTVPYPIKEACIVQASRWFKRAESAYADAVATGEMGLLVYRKSLDVDVQAMLISARLVRPAIG
jgi:hypothetical protein